MEFVRHIIFSSMPFGLNLFYGFAPAVPYPFLTENTFPIRVVIYIVVTAIAFLSFRAINAVHKVLTGRYTPAKEKST